jgi:hypothetical protein
MSNKPYGDFLPKYRRNTQQKKNSKPNFPQRWRTISMLALWTDTYCVWAPIYPKYLFLKYSRSSSTEQILDTVCGYELFQMKKHFLETDILEIKNFYPAKHWW